MARPRVPTKILELRGAFKKHPERKRQRATEFDEEGKLKDESPLGPPPAYLDEAELARWAEIVDMVPAGVLTKRDRLAVEMLCQLWCKLRKRKLSNMERQQMLSLLGRLGLSPSDRSRVGAPSEPKKGGNPFGRLA